VLNHPSGTVTFVNHPTHKYMLKSFCMTCGRAAVATIPEYLVCVCVCSLPPSINLAYIIHLHVRNLTTLKVGISVQGSDVMSIGFHDYDSP
jgi:hypothetical protein